MASKSRRPGRNGPKTEDQPGKIGPCAAQLSYQSRFIIGLLVIGGN